MSGFNTKKNKLSKLWEEIEKNKSLIENNDNEAQLQFFSNLFIQQHIKTPVQIFDSGQKALLKGISGSNAIKGDKIPSIIPYSQIIDLELPESLLPFVKYSINVTTLPDTEIHGTYVSDPSHWIGDHLDVRGDGQIIYRGQPLVTSSFNPFFITHATETLISNGISLSLTKETWEAQLVFIPSDPLNGAFGKVTFIEGTEILLENSCLSNNNIKKFAIDHSGNKNHKIINLDATGFTGIGNEIITTYTDDGEGGCDTNQVINSNVTRTIGFDTIDDYRIGLAEPTQIGATYSKSRIESQTFTKGGRWLFYSTELDSIFETKLTGNPDGDFQEIELSNLPTDVTPYTQIVVKRNLEGTNILPSTEKFSEDNSNNRTLLVARAGREYENYVKLSKKSEAVAKWRYKLNGDFLFLGNATSLVFVTRNKDSITTQEFKSVGGNNWNVIIDKDENSKLTGKVANIYHKKVELSGSVTTEFFTDPNSNPLHGILSLNSTSYQAVGDEVVTIIPFDPELPPVITKRNNIIATKIFTDATDYSIGIINTTDFPVYNDIYTIVDDVYTLTTEDHTLLSKDVWGVPSSELTINIKAYLVNPLYWREERKYNKNDI